MSSILYVRPELTLKNNHVSPEKNQVFFPIFHISISITLDNILIDMRKIATVMFFTVKYYFRVNK